jgi:hypothetical protein
MMDLAVTMTGSEPVTVKITPKVIVAAERQFKLPMAQLFNAENMSFESMTWLAWKGMHTAGHVVKTFDLWLDDLEAVEFATPESVAPLGGGEA